MLRRRRDVGRARRRGRAGGGRRRRLLRSEIRAPGDVFNPDVPFEDRPEETPEPTPEPEPERPRRRRSTASCGRSTATPRTHRRVFQPRKPLRGPFRRVWRRKATAAARVPARDRAGHALPARRRRLAGGPRQGHRAAALAAQGRHAGRLLARRGRAQPLRDRARDADGGAAAGSLSLRLRDGRIRWSRALPSRSESSPWSTGNRMYFGSEDGTVYCVAREPGGSCGATGRPARSRGARRWPTGCCTSATTAARCRRPRLERPARVGQRRRRAAPHRHVLRHGGGGVRPRLHRQHGRARVLLLGPRRLARLGPPDRQLRVLLGGGAGRPATRADGLLRLLRQLVLRAERTQRGRPLALGLGRADLRLADHRQRHRVLRQPRPAGDVGLDVRTGRRVFGPREGGYDPVVSDGTYLFLTGYRTISALLPQPEFRRRRQAARERRAGSARGAAAGRARPSARREAARPSGGRPTARVAGSAAAGAGGAGIVAAG